MNMVSRLLSLAAIILLFWAGTVQRAEALSLTAWGGPVDGIGSNSVVALCGSPGVGSGCYDAGTHNIGFYNPLNSTYNGVYGVDTNPSGLKVGTSSDSKIAPFANSNALTMYLRYTPLASSVGTDLSSAVLTFTFQDLDLAGANDPYGFFESVQFFSAGGSALSPLLTNLPVMTPTYTITGNTVSQSIVFTDVRAYITNDPFYAKLVFGSSMTQSGTWRNTREFMTSTLVTSVPEPSSLLLMGFGLAGLVWLQSKQPDRVNV
jgi:hypothetical protein